MILYIILAQLVMFLIICKSMKFGGESMKIWDSGDWRMVLMCSFIFPLGILFCLWIILDTVGFSILTKDVSEVFKKKGVAMKGIEGRKCEWPIDIGA